MSERSVAHTSLFAGTLLLAATAATPSVAAVFKDTFRGPTAEVAYDLGSGDCLGGGATIGAFDFVRNGIPGSTLRVEVFVYNFCTDQQIVSVVADQFGDVPNSAFVVNASGTQATLRYTIEGHDLINGNTPIAIAIDLVWTATSAPSNCNYIQHVAQPGFTLNQREHGKSSEASVVGTFVVGTTDYGQKPVGFAFIGRQNQTTLQILRGG